ncbi:MltR family transcriptional regulator [Pseudomonas protegens]|nr:MltR family transcriptional regulator [Pseudomonas protegens]MDK1394661.1 MltR family transcriptional regulator [Pseudomonas protegens]
MIKVSRRRNETDQPDVFSDYNEMNASLSELDARALILTVAAFAEDTLGSLLGAFFLPHDASHQLLAGFNAPLGTFSSRIKATYALGLITKGQFNDLEHLRKIRNSFSHTWKPISLDAPSVAGHVKAIHFSSMDDVYPTTPLLKLRSALPALLLELQVITNRVFEEQRSAKLIGSELIIGIKGEDGPQQLETAKAEIDAVEKNLLTAKDDERLFYISRLQVWADRLGVINRQPVHKASHQEAAALISQLNQRVAQLTS